MAQDPWAQFPDAPTSSPRQAPRPQAPQNQDPIIKPADPYKAEDQQMQRDANARAAAAADRAAAATERQAAAAERQAAKDAAGTEAQQKISTLVTRIAGGFADITNVINKDSSAQEPGVIETVRGGLDPTGLLAVPTRAIAGANRRTVHDAQRDMLDALLTLGTGAAYNAEQLTGQMASYFPALGDSKDEIAVKNQRLQRMIAAAKANAGPAWSQVEPVIAQYMQGFGQSEQTQTKEPDNKDIYGAGDTGIQYGGGGDGGPFDRERYLQDTYGIGSGDEAKIVAFWNTNKGNAGLTPNSVKQWYIANGYTKALPTDEQLAGMIQQSAKGAGFGGFDLSGAEKAYIGRLQQINATSGRDQNPGAGELAQQGLMAGLGDEAAGVGGFIGSALTLQNPIEGYRLSRDAERLRLDQARQNSGGWGTAAEFLGAAASGGTNAPNALLQLAPNQLVKEGVVLGGLQGFGAGEGAQSSVGNALLGATFGGTVGGASDRLNRVITSRTANRAAPSLDAAELATAGQAEGVTVNRAMIDPRSNNRVTNTDASLLGGPRVQAGMQQIEGQIARRVDEIGGGGQILDKVAEGDVYKTAAERAIRETGDIAKRRYDRAAQLAGDTKVAPRESLIVIDEMLTKLGETPNRNAAELSFLQGLKDDLSKNLSVGALRDLRTDLRKKISSGQLVFGQNEARVLEIMDAASTDIRNGLVAAGKTNAAKAFDAADKGYRARMDYINGTLQKVIGKRNANLSSEQIADKVASLSKSDAKGFRRFYASLSPDEALDVSTTVAERLGHNGKDGFSVAHFLTQTSPKKMSDTTLVTLFGQSGAQSIKNLRTLGEQITRVTGAMNSRTSKSGVAGDMRSWVVSLVLGSIPGAAGGVLPALGTAATVGAIKAGNDILTARALMSPKITKWLAQTPATNSPRAITAHLDRLTRIAANDNAIASDAIGLRQALEAMLLEPNRAAAGTAVSLPASSSSERTNTPQ